MQFKVEELRELQHAKALRQGSTSAPRRRKGEQNQPCPLLSAKQAYAQIKLEKKTQEL